MIITRQRRMMVDELMKIKTHPTADEFYVIVRRKMPKISLGSVYRNLEALSNEGIIAEIKTSGTQKRFDATTSKHHHVCCPNCSAVADFHSERLANLDCEIEKLLQECSLESYRIEFTGLCEKCRAKNASSNNRTAIN